MPLKNPPISPTEKNKSKKKVADSLKKDNIEEVKVDSNSLDSREEFFKLMAEKIKDKEIDKSSQPSVDISEEIKPVEDEQDAGQSVVDYETFDEVEIKKDYKPKSSNHYRKMIYRFSFLTLVLLAAVAYFSFLKLEIIIKSEKNTLESNLSFYTYSDNSQIEMDRAIKASISRVELEESNVFQATGEENLGGEIVGKVTIKNEYSKNQPLVATTRILSSGDKLFRIKDTVNVPAGSSIEVDIYADTVSEEMAIGPDKFIIPGLWAGLQDKIYAESFETFEFKKSSSKFISSEDIELAKEYLNQKLVEQAKSKAQNIGNNGRQYVVDLNSSTSVITQDKKVGDEAQEFEMKIKNLVTIISFETDDIVSLAKQRLALETNQAPAEILVDSLEYELVNFNSSKNLAELKLNFSARASSVSDSIINKQHLTNLNQKQIEAYLSNIEDIDSYELKFSPSFIKMSPLLVSKIFIEYK
ncbi:MAG: hypothetical protein WC280_02545 [Patescibacteria group bacterium]